MDNLQDPDEASLPLYGPTYNPAAIPFEAGRQGPQRSSPGPPSSRPSSSSLRATAEPFVPNVPANSHGTVPGRSLPACDGSTTIALSSPETFYRTMTRNEIHSGSAQVPVQPAQLHSSGLPNVAVGSRGYYMNPPNNPGPQAFTHTSPQTYMGPTHTLFGDPSPANMGIPVQHWPPQTPSRPPAVPYAPPQLFLAPHQAPIQGNLQQPQNPPLLQPPSMSQHPLMSQHSRMPQHPPMPQHAPTVQRTQQPQYLPLPQHAPLSQHPRLPQHPQYAPQNPYGSRSFHFSTPQGSMQHVQSVRPRDPPVYASSHQGHAVLSNSRPYSFLPGPISASTPGAWQPHASEFISTRSSLGSGGYQNDFNSNLPHAGPSDQPLVRIPVTHGSAPPHPDASKSKGKTVSYPYQQAAQPCTIYSCTEPLPHVHIRTAVIQGPLPPFVKQNYPSSALKNPNTDTTRPQFAIGRIDVGGDDWEIGGKILGPARTQPQCCEADSSTPRKFSFGTERIQGPMQEVTTNPQQSWAMAGKMPPNLEESPMWANERPHAVDIHLDAGRDSSSRVEKANKKREGVISPRNNHRRTKNEATGLSSAIPHHLRDSSRPTESQRPLEQGKGQRRHLQQPGSASQHLIATNTPSVRVGESLPRRPWHDRRSHRHQAQESPFHPNDTGSRSNEPPCSFNGVGHIQEGQNEWPRQVQEENQSGSDGSYGYPSVSAGQKGGSASPAPLRDREMSVAIQPGRLERGPSQDSGEQQQQQQQQRHQTSLPSRNQKKRRKESKEGKNGE